MGISEFAKAISNGDGTEDDSSFSGQYFFFVSSVSYVSLKGYNHNNHNVKIRVIVNQRDPDDRVKFIDIQAEISATGNAAAAQVRLSERVPLQPAYDRPEFAITSATSVCKVFVGDQDKGTTTYGISVNLLCLQELRMRLAANVTSGSRYASERFYPLLFHKRA